MLLSRGNCFERLSSSVFAKFGSPLSLLLALSAGDAFGEGKGKEEEGGFGKGDWEKGFVSCWGVLAERSLIITKAKIPETSRIISIYLAGSFFNADTSMVCCRKLQEFF